MNIWLQDYDRDLTIAGFRDVNVKNINDIFRTLRCKTDDSCVQLFDASRVAGCEHVLFAALNALNSFKNQVNISATLAMETLLYASSQPQIKDAVRLIGIKNNTKKVAVLILVRDSEESAKILHAVSELLKGRRDDSVLDLTQSKIPSLKRVFGISKSELEAGAKGNDSSEQALTNLIIEHMALLVSRR